MSSRGETNRGFDHGSSEQIGRQISQNHNGSTNNRRFAPRTADNRIIVHVEGANKSYNQGQQILKNFNMAVQENTIYGLLGASGCGKTTILSCIVALNKLDSGTILVCGKPTGTPTSGIPGKKVGYMPQEIALNNECTIREVLSYFGRIYGMPQSDITERHNYLITLLSLQGLTQTIENLSDGQKRRVSMCVALLHEPDILILDEPTVGCDPLLRESIWTFLHGLAFRNRATIIVTTHYIEEMRQADRVGIMRNGRLLCEDSPLKLLQMYNETLLDNVVLKLCQKDENPNDLALQERPSSSRNMHSSSIENGVEAIRMDTIEDDSFVEIQLGAKIMNMNVTRVQWTTGPLQSKSTTSCLDRLHALFVKNVLVLIRNFWFLICLIIIPATSVTLVCMAIGSKPSGLRIGLVNFETADCLDKMNTEINKSIAIDCKAPNDLSCSYLKSVDRDIVTFVEVDSIEEAIEITRDKRMWGYVAFGKDFSPNFFKRIVTGSFDNDTIIGSQINLQLDMAGVSTGQVLKKVFLDGYSTLVQNLLEGCDIISVGRDMPVSFGEPIFGEEDAELTEFMGPGMSLGFVFFVCAIQCGITHMLEKKDGMLHRTMVAGVSTVEIMISHFVVQFFVTVFQIVICFVIMSVVFSIPSKGSIFLAFVIVLVNSCAGMSLGFLLATFCDDEKYAMLFAIAMIFPNFLLAGLLWPPEGLPVVLQYTSYILPCTLSAEAFRSILLRGFSITHHVVWYGLVSSGAWICVYWIIIVVWHKWTARQK